MWLQGILQRIVQGIKILNLASQYIFSLLLFVVHDKGYFAPNSVYHDFNTRHKNDLHLPHASLTIYQRGVFYSGIKVFNALPTTINPLMPNGHYSGLTVPLTSIHCI
jgi:hypothetical protein